MSSTQLLRPFVRSSAAGWLAVLCALWALAPKPAIAQSEALQARQVSQHVWFVQGLAALGSSANRNFISNAAFVTTGEGVLVVDGLGSPALAEALLAEIRRVTQEPIRYVVVTHYHADHIYGLQVFQAAGAQIVAHRAAKQYLNSENAALRLEASRTELAPWIDESTRLVPADIWVDEQWVLNLGRERFHLRHAGPAHTPEDLTVMAEREGILFAGDLVFRNRIPFVGQADSGAWVSALDGLLKWRARLVVPGHGPITDQPSQDLQLTRDYLQHLRMVMGQAARDLEPFDEAYAKADWSRFEGMPLFGVANRINAYNTYLLMERSPSP
jgi:glyoxylase-like metal-dependent hydrolase (beta-lactamase superfamily II)